MKIQRLFANVFVLPAVTLGFLAVAVFPAFAQTDDYGTGTTAGTYCPQLSQTVVRGSSGNQVLELQKFLSDYYDVPPATIQTGYFGRITQGYVIQFQKEQGLPSYGIAGSMTRAAIAKVCGTKSSVTSLSPSPSLNSPTLAPEYAAEKLTVTASTDKNSYVGNNPPMSVSWSVQGFSNGKVSGAHTLVFCQERVDETLPTGHEGVCHSIALSTVTGSYQDAASCVSLVKDWDKPTITCRMKVSVIVPMQCPPSNSDMPPLCPNKVLAAGYTDSFTVINQDAYGAFQTYR
ncbi:MAG: peptidoglycan-binding domain-containing protein [bacterium]